MSVDTIEQRLAALQPRIRQAAVGMTRNRPSLRDDAAQEGMIGAWQALQARPDEPDAYALGAARRAAWSRACSGSRAMTGSETRRGSAPSVHRTDVAVESLDEWDHPETAAAYDDPDVATAVTVRAAVLDLPVEDRELLLLRYWQGLSERETAARLGSTQSRVSKRFDRAIAPVLREALA